MDPGVALIFRLVCQLRDDVAVTVAEARRVSEEVVNTRRIVSAVAADVERLSADVGHIRATFSAEADASRANLGQVSSALSVLDASIVCMRNDVSQLRGEMDSLHSSQNGQATAAAASHVPFAEVPQLNLATRDAPIGRSIHLGLETVPAVAAPTDATPIRAAPTASMDADLSRLYAAVADLRALARSCRNRGCTLCQCRPGSQTRSPPRRCSKWIGIS